MSAAIQGLAPVGGDSTGSRVTGALYEDFFGLRERPFDLLPNPRYLFLAGRHREALSTLRYGLSVPKGLTLLLGEAGTGKSTLLQSALADLDRDHIECVQLSNPTLTREEFYEALAAGFGLGADAAASKTRFLVELRRHLEARQAQGHCSAIVLDEAQSAPYDLLEEVRLLSNIETPTAKLLNVVLAGQPELSTRLNETSLRQLKQRISLRCQIRPFLLQESAAYIAGRIRIAGGQPAEIFTRDAIHAIHEMSQGIPRTINVICDNALIDGFGSQVKPVVRATVEQIGRDFDLKAPGQAEGDGETSPRRDHLAETAGLEPRSREPEPAAKTPTFGTALMKRFSFF